MLHKFNFKNKANIPNDFHSNLLEQQQEARKMNKEVDVKQMEYHQRLLEQIEENRKRRELERQKKIEEDRLEDEKIRNYNEKIQENKKKEEEHRLRLVNKMNKKPIGQTIYDNIRDITTNNINTKNDLKKDLFGNSNLNNNQNISSFNPQIIQNPNFNNNNSSYFNYNLQPPILNTLPNQNNNYPQNIGVVNNLLSQQNNLAYPNTYYPNNNEMVNYYHPQKINIPYPNNGSLNNIEIPNNYHLQHLPNNINNESSFINSINNFDLNDNHSEKTLINDFKDAINPHENNNNINIPQEILDKKQETSKIVLKMAEKESIKYLNKDKSFNFDDIITQQLNLLKTDVERQNLKLNEFISNLRNDILETCKIKMESDNELHKIKNQIENRRKLDILYERKLNDILEKHAPYNNLHIPINEVHPLYTKKPNIYQNDHIESSSKMISIPKEEENLNNLRINTDNKLTLAGQSLISRTQYNHNRNMFADNQSKYSRVSTPAMINNDKKYNSSDSINYFSNGDASNEKINLNNKIDELNKIYRRYEF